MNVIFTSNGAWDCRSTPMDPSTSCIVVAVDNDIGYVLLINYNYQFEWIRIEFDGVVEFGVTHEMFDEMFKYDLFDIKLRLCFCCRFTKMGFVWNVELCFIMPVVVVNDSFINQLRVFNKSNLIAKYSES
ncbi:hypothetical protein Drorol1_Dr00003434 [Drosera rotundifolia]